jgi:hypothetical protein
MVGLGDYKLALGQLDWEAKVIGRWLEWFDGTVVDGWEDDE